MLLRTEVNKSANAAFDNKSPFIETLPIYKRVVAVVRLCFYKSSQYYAPNPPYL